MIKARISKGILQLTIKTSYLPNIKMTNIIMLEYMTLQEYIIGGLAVHLWTISGKRFFVGEVMGLI